VRDTATDWEKLARDNAYWAVLNEKQFAGRPTADTLAAFFARGVRDVKGFQSEIKRIFPEFSAPFTRIIDFGCGVGRLLIPMAREARHAFGIDVSETMRELTIENALSFGLTNVTCLADCSDLLKVGVKANWVNGYLVFQHIEPRRGYYILNDLLQCVAAGGYVSLHFPLFKTSDRREYFNDRVMYFRNDYYYTETVFIDRDNYEHPDIQMYDYDANTLIALFHKNEIDRVHLIHDGSMSGIHSYVLIGRRAA
jgi:SAM-dependent methyltransferase